MELVLRILGFNESPIRSISARKQMPICKFSFALSDTWRKSKRSGGTKQEKNREREVNETTNRGGKSFEPESDDEMEIPLGFLREN